MVPKRGYHSLLLLLLPLFLVWAMNVRVDSTLLPEHLHAKLRHRTSNHMAQLQTAAAAAATSRPSDPSAPTSRHLLLGPSTSPSPIRISPQLQLPATMSSSDKNSITQAAMGTIKSLQILLQVRQPVGASGLLVAPQYVSSAQCALAQSHAPSSTCAAPGYYPSFGAVLPASDVLAPLCGPAAIDPAHVMSAAACQLARGAAVDPACTRSAAGTSGGAQTDHYLYGTSDTSDCGDGILAFASPCLFDLTTNRPVMSYFNVCPLALTSLTPQQLINTLTHELTHALGFSPDLWNPSPSTPGGLSLFIDDSGRPLRASSVLAYQAASPDLVLGSRPATLMLRTPTVLAEVRQHFGCSTLAGAALEDDGGDGSAGSHWEYELFQGELMTAEAPADADWQRFSRLTLALLQDSGWFLGNWSQAFTLQWGRGAGCSIALQTCSRYQATAGARQPYFCSAASNSVGGCTFNGRSWGTCYLGSQFSNCGIVTTPNPPSSAAFEPACVSSAYSTYGAVGPSARCLAAPQGFSFPITSSPCWEAQCSPPASSPMVLTYRQAGAAITCTSPPAAGANPAPCPLDVAAVCATLQCPAGGCSAAGGDCFSGACACRLGYAGGDCRQRADGSLTPSQPESPGLQGPSPSHAQGVHPSSAFFMIACSALSIMLLSRL